MQRLYHTALPFIFCGAVLALFGVQAIAVGIKQDFGDPPGKSDSSYLQQLKVEAGVTRPFGFVESPSAGASVFGTITVSGWAVAALPIANLAILVDGEAVVQNIPLTIPRPDVCSVLGTYPNCPYVGFRTNLNTGFMLPGTHSITLRITDNTGVSGVSLNMPLVVKAAVEIRGNLEQPVEGQTILGSLSVSGWTIGSRSIQTIEVLVDGVGVGNAVYGLYRPDVCTQNASFGGCANSGFSFTLNSNLLSAGTHTLQARARDVGGATYAFPALPRTFNKPSSYILGVLDVPTVPPPFDALNMWIVGWAVSTSSITRVEVLVDSTKVADALYGTSRPDVCYALGTFTGCPNVGFEYNLDYARLSLGAHQLRIQVVAANGTTFLLPAEGSIPFTVNFQPTTTTSMLFTTTTISSTNPSTTTTLVAGTPILYELSPTFIQAGGPDFTLSIFGSGFITGSTIVFNGQDRPTFYPGFGSNITASIYASDIATIGSKTVKVRNGALESNTLLFEVVAAGSTTTTTVTGSTTTTAPGGSTTSTTLSPGSPQIIELNPVSRPAGSGAFILQVIGTGLNSQSQVIFGTGTTPKAATFYLPFTLSVPISASEVLATGIRKVKVRNSDGQESQEVDFTVTGTGSTLTTTFTTSTTTPSTTIFGASTSTTLGSWPVITSLVPSQARQGDTVDLTINGTNFAPGCWINFGTYPSNITPIITTPNSLSVVIPPGLTSTTGLKPVKVTNPDGKVSAPVNFSVIP